MTYEEAHAYLENLQREFTTHRRAYSDKLIEANGAAISALEKQIPKQIGNGVYAGKCDCGNYVFADQNYCPKCGQALDWSETE